MKTYTNHMYGDHMSLPRTARDYQCPRTYQDNSFNDDEVHEQETSGDRHQKGFPPEFKTIMVNWILRIRECCKLTQATMEEIIQRVTDLNQYILSLISSAVTAAITKAGMDPSNCPELQNIFDPNGIFGRPFRDLETSYHQQQYLKANLGFVVRNLMWLYILGRWLTVGKVVIDT